MIHWKALCSVAWLVCLSCGDSSWHAVFMTSHSRHSYNRSFSSLPIVSVYIVSERFICWTDGVVRLQSFLSDFSVEYVHSSVRIICLFTLNLVPIQGWSSRWSWQHLSSGVVNKLMVIRSIGIYFFLILETDFRHLSFSLFELREWHSFAFRIRLLDLRSYLYELLVFYFIT